MHRAIELVGPCGIGKNALHAEIHLTRSLFVSHDESQALNDFIPPQREIFGAVIQHLCASVRRRLCPSIRFAGRFYRVADIFSIAQRSFTE